MKYKQWLIVVGTALLMLVGGLMMYGQQTQPKATLSLATSAHIIDQAAVLPAQLTTGSTQPITFAVTISDPAVIATSVNIIWIKADGSSSILGTLTPVGSGGFTLTTSTPPLPVGKIDLRVSAAFSGTLKRVQSSDFFLTIVPVYSRA